jgi:predicted phage tail protein
MGAAKQIDIHGAKGGSGSAKTPVEASDSLRSTNLAKILIAVGEGEFDGTPTAADIYLDNTPINDASGNVNFPNVTWAWRTGSLDQSYIPGIPSVENETTVNVELRSDTAWVRSLTNTQLSAVRLRLAWPALQKQDDEGNVGGYRIEYAIDVATDGGAYQQVLDEAVDGKTTTRYERSRRIDLPAATSGWQIRVRRITANQNTNKIADTMLVAGYTEVIDAKLRYPNTALLYIEFDAEQFTNIPAVTVKCKARKWQVPSNYDPIARTYSGVWDGTFKQAWTNNPAWITFGICTEDRFGLGKRIKSWMVDKWELFRIAQYCDQSVPNGLGGTEPRFLCDMNLQGKADAWSLLRDIAGIYRGMTYWAQGQLVMQADMPRAQDFDYVFTRANVIDGKFSYGSASSKTRYTRALVSYDNPSNNYDTDVIPYADLELQRRFGDKPTEISAIGCTRASEAQRRGKWVVMSNSQDRTVSFKTGMEGSIPLPGYIIPIADTLLAGREVGGRISVATARVITLDRDTQAKAGDRLIINLPNGKAEGRTVQSVSGRAITVTTAYSQTPVAQLQWALDANDLAIPLYRVLSVKRTTEGDYEINALQYEPSKFDYIDTGARLEERPISVIPITVVPAPASIALASTTAIAQGLAVTTMTISWPAVAGAVAYDVEWRKDSGNWIKVQRTGNNSVDITGIYAGGYLARVRAVSAFDISSTWRTSVLTQLNGKEGLPPAVTSLVATPLLFGIGLKWAFPAGAEDTQRTELWYGPTTDLATATKLADLAYPQNAYSMQQLLAGARFFFWARLVDRTGNIGPWYPVGSGVMGQASAEAGPILDMIAGQIGETELGKELSDRIDLIDGPPSLPGSVSNRLDEAKQVVDEQIQTVSDQVAQVNDQVAEVQAVVADINNQVVDLNQQVADIIDSAEYQKDQAYKAGDSTRLDGRLYQAKIAVPADETGAKAPPNSTYWLDVGQVVSDSNGLAARVTTAESRLTSVEGVNTSQGTALTGLSNSLTTTNTNVTAAQNAANAANTLAGSKGKVLVQTAAPTAADQLAQNLWIDITGGANTPKRWNGSAWAAVTDKVATDAAAAATNALSLANTKADAAAVNSLTTRVTTAEGTISSQGSSITGLNNSLTTTNTNVTAAQNAANAANTLAGGKGKVLVQTAAPAAADQLVQNLWIDITGGANTPKRWNGSAWAAVTDKVATDAAAAAANALSVANTKADAAAVNSLTTRVTSAEGKLTSQGDSITSLNNSLTTTNGNVTAAQNAANAANTLAGGKGKVLVQSTTPVAADQLAQNLWIDITSNANTPKRWTGSVWVAVTDKAATDASAAAASALAQVATKAESSTVSALSNTVTQQGTTLTAQGNSITAINASIGSLGGQNLAYNPSFEREGSAGVAQGWYVRNGAGVTSVNSIVDSSLAYGEKAQRMNISGLSATSWYALGLDATHRATIQPGKDVTESFYVKAPVGVKFRPEYWATRADGTNASTGNTLNTTGDGTWQRVSVTFTAPVDAVSCVPFIVIYGTADIGSAVVDVDRCQVEIASAMSGWSDNNGVVATDVAVSAAATTALTGRVTTVEGVVTSQGARVTSLENSVNNATSGLGAKASAASVDSLTNRVTVAEGAITSQGASITSIQATVNGISGNGTNLIPGEFTSFFAALPTMNKAFAATITSEADTTATGGFLLKFTSTSPTVQDYLYLGSSQADFNLRLTPSGKYICSFWAKGDVAHTLSVRVRYLNSVGATVEVELAQQAITTTMARYTVPVTMPAALVSQAVMVFFTQKPIATGVTWFDGFMLERQIGASQVAGSFVPGTSTRQYNAAASANTALDARVTSAENTITSQSSSITSLNNSIGSVGGENLLYNPSFEKVGTTSGLAEGWRLGNGAGAASVPSLVASGIDPAGKAQRVELSGLTASNYVDTGIVGANRPSVSSGQVLSMSAYARATAGLILRLYFQFKDAAGTTIGTDGPTSITADGSVQRVTRTAAAAPVNAVSVDLLYRVVGTASLSAGFVEWDRAQLEISPVMTGWKDNAKTLTADQAATSAALSSLSGTVTQQGTTITSQGASLTSLTNRVTAAEGVNTGQAGAISSIDTRVTSTEAAITAQAQRTDGLYAQLTPDYVGDDDWSVGESTVYAGTVTVQSVSADANGVTARRMDTVEVKTGENSAAVQTVAQAQANMDGQLSTMWSVKMQINANGQYVAAGIGLGIEDNGAGLQSQFLVSADRFAIVGTLAGGTTFTPFVVQGGQVFMNSAFIQNGSITMLQIGQYLQSDNYVPGVQGWRLDKAGNLEFNGPAPGGGRMAITNRALKVFDQNGVKRVQLGDLDA